jgi:hypothetical protein
MFSRSSKLRPCNQTFAQRKKEGASLGRLVFGDDLDSDGNDNSGILLRMPNAGWLTLRRERSFVGNGPEILQPHGLRPAAKCL